MEVKEMRSLSISTRVLAALLVLFAFGATSGLASEEAGQNDEPQEKKRVSPR